MRRDLQHAVRTLGRSPGYTLAVLLTLSLGIGATTAVFSVLRSVLLEPLPYAPVNRAVIAVERDSAGNDRLASYPTFQDWRAGTRLFEALAFARGLGALAVRKMENFAGRPGCPVLLRATTTALMLLGYPRPRQGG